MPPALTSPPRRDDANNLIRDAHDRQGKVDPKPKKTPPRKPPRGYVDVVSGREYAPQALEPKPVKQTLRAIPKPHLHKDTSSKFLWGIPESFARAFAALAAYGSSVAGPASGPLAGRPLASKQKREELVESLVGDDTLARDWILGPETYKYMTGRPYDKRMLAVELGSWLLGTSVSKAAFGAARAPIAFGIVAGKQGARAGAKAGVRAGLQAARAEVGKGSAIIRGIKALNQARVQKRWLDPLGRHVLGLRRPAAKSLLGRKLESAIVSVAPERIKKQRAGVYLRRTERILRDVDAADVDRLRSYAKKLDIDQVYAIRALASGVMPEDRMAFHERLFEESEEALTKYAHSVHADLNKIASRYVQRIVDEDGVPRVVLREDAPEKLKQAWRLYQRVYRDREDILVDHLDHVTYEMIGERIQAVGKIMKGGEWIENEVWARKQLMNSPHRQRLVRALEKEVESGRITRDRVEGVLAMMDTLSRSRAQNLREEIKRKKSRALSKLMRAYDQLDDDLTGEIDAQIRAIEQEIEELDILLSEEIPADILYQSLHEVDVGFPDWLIEYHRATRGSGYIFFRARKAADKIVDEELRMLKEHLKRPGSKNYLPSGYRTKQGLKKLVNELYERAEEGIDIAKWWYRDSGREILAHSGGNLDLADKIAALVAIYSPQQNVMVNVGLALRVLEELRLYGEAKTGEAWQRRLSKLVFEGNNWLDGLSKDRALKVKSFYANILKHIDPDLMRSKGFTGREVTVDGWMGLAAHLGEDANQLRIGTSKYRWIERMVQRIADDMGLEPEQVQAAIWASVKAERDRYLRHLPRDEALRRASLNISHALHIPHHRVRFAFEAASSHIPEYWTWSKEVQEAFTRANADAVIDALRQEGIPGRLNDYGVGVWLNPEGVVETNPAVAAELAIGMPPSERRLFVSEEERKLYDGIAAVIASALKQEGVGWMRPVRATARQQSTFFRVTSRATPEQLARIQEMLSDVAYLTQTSNGFMVVRYDPEAVLRARGEAQKKLTDAFRSRVFATLDEVLGKDAFVVDEGAHNGGYIAGQSGIQIAIDSAGRPDLLRRLHSRLSASTSEILESFRADPEGAARAYLGASRGLEEGSLLTSSGPFYAVHGMAVHGPIGEGGRYVPAGKTSVFVGRVANDPLETWVHELGHLLQVRGLTEREHRVLSRFYNNFRSSEDAERFVEDLITYYLIGGPSPALLHDTQTKRAFRKLAEGLREEMAGSNRLSRQAIPPQVRDVLEFLHEFKELRGGRIRGAEHSSGVAKEPFKPGLPLPLRKNLRNWRMYVTFALGNRRSAIGRMWSDPTTRKPFKGYLLKSGLFKANVLESAAEEVAKAIKLKSVMRLRETMLRISTELPENSMAIAIKVDPDKKVSPMLAKYMAIISDIDDGMTVPEAIAKSGLPETKLFSKEQLERIENSYIDEFIRELFPDGPDIEVLKRSMLEGYQGAIPNIRWVDPLVLETSEAITPPNFRRLQREAWSKMARGTASVLDVANDIFRITLLYLNPAYIPMNLVGNLVMNFSQQGFMAPYNIYKAFRLNAQIAEELLSVVDVAMGRGFSSMLDLRTLKNKPSDAFAGVVNRLVDLIPRRAAWLHEARRLGYKTPDEIASLITRAKNGEAKAVDDFVYITQLAKEEIVDFSNLSAFERDVMTRIIFVYPWIKGATVYALRFPFNHPLQTTALAFLYLRQQELANQEVGERPDYLNLYMPLGEVERWGEEYPYGLNLRQMFTASTPFDTAKAIYGFAKGEIGTQPLTEFAQPIYSTILSHVTGYDPFLDKKVPRGAIPLAKGMAGAISVDSPLGQAIERITRSDAERRRLAEEGALYPRNRFDDWMRSIFGTLVSGPVNPETAGRRAREGQAKSTAGKMQEFLDISEKVWGRQPPAWIIETYAKRLRYEEIQKDLRRELGTSALGVKGTTLARMRLAAEVYPQFNLEKAQGMLDSMSDEEARQWGEEIWEILGFEDEDYRVWMRRVEQER